MYFHIFLTGTTNHISSNVNVKAHSEECLPALLGFETSSTGNQHSDLQDHHTCAGILPILATLYCH